MNGGVGSPFSHIPHECERPNVYTHLLCLETPWIILNRLDIDPEPVPLPGRVWNTGADFHHEALRPLDEIVSCRHDISMIHTNIS